MEHKKLVTIQDISCLGQCSLTAALPVISALGVETVIMPTAVLSTHTGGFTGYTFHDLTEEMPKIADHWQSLGLAFDAIYTGYLGSFKQIEYVSDFIDRFRSKDTVVFVDPAMGDNGRLYAGFDNDFAVEMTRLCSKADIIAPNLTEAAFMLQKPYVGSGYSDEYIEQLLLELSELGAKKVILTGVSFEKGKLGAAYYDAETDSVSYYFTDGFEGSFHGTGDLFSSVFIGSYLKERSVEQSVKLAADFVCAAIGNTVNSYEGHEYGVRFEECLPMLMGYDLNGRSQVS